MRSRSQPPPEDAPQEQPTTPTLGALGAAAAAGALAPSAALPGEVPLAVGTVTALTAAQVAQSAAKIIKAFGVFGRKRSAYVYPYLTNLIARVYPERTPDEIAALVREEMRREVEFRNKAKERLRRLLPEALKEPDPELRRQAVQRILERERDYVRMREEAMAARAMNTAERVGVKEHSPLGAFWKLSDSVKEHTLDCLLMGNKFWPWKVLDTFHPQLHPGCACELLTFDEAVQRGYMLSSQIPDVNDAVIRAKEIMERTRHLNESLDEADVLGYILEIQENQENQDFTEITEAIHTQAHLRLRYPKGTVKGGEFRPRRGGNPGAPTISRRAMRALRHALPHMPETPTQSATHGRGRWVWIKGMRTFVPEYRAFEREIGGTQFYSPNGSTHVYRDGHLVDTPEGGPTHRDMKRGMAPTKLTPKAASLDVEVATEKLAQILANQKRRATDREVGEHLHMALADMSENVNPVLPGASGRATHEALLDSNFRVVATHSGGARERLIDYVHGTTGSNLNVLYNVDAGDGTVERATWNPKTLPLDLTAPLATAPPENWQAFKEDVAAFAGAIAREQNSVPFLTGIEIDPDSGDHNGTHEWSGVIRLASGIEPSITAMARKRAADEPLTNAELRNVYDGYQTAIHEALHAAFPIRQADFQEKRSNAALEEALTEEVSHHYTIERLRATGQTDVLAWVHANPLDQRVTGTYMPYRDALDRIFNEAQVAPESRLDHMLALKRETSSFRRKRMLAQLIVDAHGIDGNEAGKRVESILTDAGMRWSAGQRSRMAAPISTPDTSDAPYRAEAMLHGVPIYGGARVSVLALPASWGDEGSQGFRRDWMQKQGAPALPHDGEIVSIHVGDTGEHNFVATVKLDDGRTLYNVLDKEVLGVLDSGLAPEPRTASIGGETFRQGDLIHYNGIKGGGLSEAVIERVLSGDEHGYVIQARTNEQSDRPDTVVLLTPERVGDVLAHGPRPEAQLRDRRGTGGAIAGPPPEVTLNEIPPPISGAFNPNSDAPVFTGLAQTKTRRGRDEAGKELMVVRPEWQSAAKKLRSTPGQGHMTTRWTKAMESEREATAKEVKQGDSIRFTDRESGDPWRMIAREVSHEPNGVTKITTQKGAPPIVFGPNEPVTIIHTEPGVKDAVKVMAKRSGLSVTAYNKATREHLAALTKDAQVAVRVRSETLPFLLQEGRLRNAHHGLAVDPGDSSRDEGYVGSREDFERKVWSIDAPAAVAADDYPVYGYLTTRDEQVTDSSASAFGDVRVTLKPWVRGRTTFNYSDSLYVTATGKHPYIVPSPLDQPSELAVSHFQSVLDVEKLVHEVGDRPNELPPLTPQEQRERDRAPWPESWDSMRRERLEEDGSFRRWKHGDFFEAHIHGGVSIPDDVHSMTFSTTPAQEIQDHLNELGIAWGVFPDWPQIHASVPPDDGLPKSKIVKVPSEVNFEPTGDAPDSPTMRRLAAVLEASKPGDGGFVLPGRVWIQRTPDVPVEENEFTLRSPDGVRLFYDAESAAAVALDHSWRFQLNEAEPMRAPPGVTAERVHESWDGFEYGDLRAGVSETTELVPGLWRSEGHIFGKDGKIVGSFLRTVRGDTVEHESLVLDKEIRGAGFATAFNANAEQHYREMGMTKIKLATADVGGYAWARAGYQFDPEWYDNLARFHAGLPDGTGRGQYEGARRVLDYYGESFVREHAAAGGVPPEVVQEFIDKFPTRAQIVEGGASLVGKFKSEFEIAGWGREHPFTNAETGEKTWLGKLVMVNSGWQGIKNLDPPEPPVSQVPDDQRVYIAEGAMKRGGLDGGEMISKIGHIDSPEQQAENARLSKMAQEISGDPTLRVIVSNWISGPGGQEGHAVYKATYHTISIRPVSDKLTFLHEIAHAMTRSQHGVGGHGKEFQEVLADLYEKHIGKEAARTFRSLLSPLTEAFDEVQHPRDRSGQWVKKAWRDLVPGDRVRNIHTGWTGVVVKHPQVPSKGQSQGLAKVAVKWDRSGSTGDVANPGMSVEHIPPAGSGTTSAPSAESAVPRTAVTVSPGLAKEIDMIENLDSIRTEDDVAHFLGEWGTKAGAEDFIREWLRAQAAKKKSGALELNLTPDAVKFLWDNLDNALDIWGSNAEVGYETRRNNAYIRAALALMKKLRPDAQPGKVLGEH